MDADLPPAQGDPDQLRHVLRNLVDNALEAMHTGGTLLLENRLVVLDENEVSPYRDLRPGSFLLLEVSDTGVGMDVDTQERAFEPFFTTRPRGEAKGLGLSMAYGAVRHHGGVIRLTSEPGKGTRVSVYLPVSGQASRRSVAPPCLSSLPPLPDPCELGRGRTALLVDDEELMRLSARRMLERFGFEVHTAAQGEIAVAMLAQDPQRYSLVLLDMIMPVLSGAEAFGKLRELRPDIPVLLCSGFARESQTDELLSRGQTGFLLKPFGLDALEKALMALRAHP
jgi:CheY-like chemotaxis protein